MNKLTFFNTLGRQKQEFVPIEKDAVRMYSCGPTVYDIAHIGNLRAYVFADVLKRTLLYNGYKVQHIMNVTDIGHLTGDTDDSGEDKMVKALKREGKEMTLEAMRETADFYFEKFRWDLKCLNVLEPYEFPFASDHIKEDTEMIQKLLEKGFAYMITDGIYFDTGKLAGYGKLGGLSDDNQARIEAVSEKKSNRDFALWKFADDEGVGFDSSFGKGFPGWHIECSAMSEKYLSVPFDIHTGGIDHIPVHHNNEIAQTEAANGVLLANFWLHNAHLTIGEEKMAKSGGNILSLEYLEGQGIAPLAYRYWLLTARYSTRMDYSLEAIKAAQTGFNKLREYLSNIENSGSVSDEYKLKFSEAVSDDIDTPKALALAWEMIKDDKLAEADKKATLLDFDRVLGLGFSDIQKLEIPAQIQALLDERKLAREASDWSRSDELRKEIEKQGYSLKDGADGNPTLTRAL